MGALLLLFNELWGFFQPVFRTIVAFVPVGVALVILRHRRYRQTEFRIRNNLCLQCGYDLRASKGRCPECGTPTTSPVPGADDLPGPKRSDSRQPIRALQREVAG